MPTEPRPETKTQIVGIDIPLWDLVLLIVKLSVATIPALIILAILWSVLGGFVLGLVAGFSHIPSK